MQVEFNPLNAVTKEINISVPSERVNKEYDKFLRKTAREVSIPGFRKGKAPLAMVERMYADTLQEHFYKDIVDVVFDEVTDEYQIHYLLFPEVKEVSWEKDSDMQIKIEIEHQPIIEFKQLEGLRVPHKPLSLDDEVAKYLETLQHDNSRVIDVEIAAEDDYVEVELSFAHGSETFTRTGGLFAGSNAETRSLEVLTGCKTGDKVEAKISGRTIMLVTRDSKLKLEQEFMYPCQLLVNSITREEIPALDDEFAKDMDFDNLEQMHAKIAEDMRLRNEQINIQIDNFSIVTKLYVDNNFDVPEKTIEYLAEQEASKVDNPEYRKFYQYQYRMQIAKELVTMYILSNLREAMPMEISPEMKEEYITHEAILEDKSVEAYKETYKDELDEEEFIAGAKNYFILRKIASSCDFFVPEEEPEEEFTLDESKEITEEQ